MPQAKQFSVPKTNATPVNTAPKNNTSDPKSIGILIPQFPGQTHIFFWREIQELQNFGTNVALFSTRMPPAGLIAHDWSQNAMDRTEYLGNFNTLGAITNAAMALLKFPLNALKNDLRSEPRAFLKDVLICLPAARRLARACRAQNISHIHAHSCGRAALICALANRLYGLNYSVTLHGPLSDYGPGQGFKWRHAAFGTVITRKLTAELKTDLGRDTPPLYLQPMGVDTNVLSRAKPYEPPVQNAPIRLFTCARLNVVKGHQDLLHAVRLLLDQGLDIQLDIAGEDDAGGNGYHIELQRLLEQLNLSDNVRLLGAIDASSVKQHLQNAHIFVLASWHEPLGVAYMEAMACGVPTIGTDAGGVPEMITSGENGLLVAPKSPEILAAAIRDLAHDPDTCARLSVNGRAHIVANYGAARGARTLLQGIDETGQTS